MIAALFVATGGAYFGLEGVDPWDATRDARLYAGPFPVVAHPPCERWGRYWHGGPSAKVRKIAGDDGGCFASALASVRRWGGVLEHPEASKAWARFGLIAPPKSGGWGPAGDWIGWTCCVEQGHYGHRARKATWLYAVRTDLPTLRWGPSAGVARLDDGFRTAEERRIAVRPPAGITPEQRAARRVWLEERASTTGKAWCCAELMGKRERAATPVGFRDMLIGIARTARAVAAWELPMMQAIERGAT